jgi:hypothetical protein
MDRPRTQGGALELKFKSKRPMGLLRTERFSQAVEDIKKRGESRQETVKKSLCEERRDEIFIYRLV